MRRPIVSNIAVVGLLAHRGLDNHTRLQFLVADVALLAAIFPSPGTIFQPTCAAGGAAASRRFNPKWQRRRN